MIIKPGKYVQRDGKIATVAAVDENASEFSRAVGWSNGHFTGWSVTGQFVGCMDNDLDLIREYQEPREFWIWNGVIYAAHPITNGRDSDVIHVREVLP